MEYASNAELRSLCAEAKTSTVSPRLAELLYALIDGFLLRYGRDIADKEDFRQELIIRLIERAIPRIFPKGGNPFSYFTQTAMNFANDYRASLQIERIAFAEFQHDCADSGNLFSVDKPEKFRPEETPRRGRKKRRTKKVRS